MPKLSPADFISKFYPDAISVTKGTNLFPETLVIQAAWESGWGGSSHAEPTINNFFGIKANSSWNGKVVSSTTYEVLGGVRQKFVGTGRIYGNRQQAINAGAHPQTLFRVYSTAQDGLKGWVSFLQDNPRYKQAGVFSAKNPPEQFAALKKAGYATATNYTASLTGLLKSHQSKFDAIIADIASASSDAISMGDVSLGTKVVNVWPVVIVGLALSFTGAVVYLKS